MFIKCDHIWKKKLTNFHSFLRDAKKKLRLALCSADSVAFPVLTHSTRNGLPDHTDPEGELLPGSLSFFLYLQVEPYEITCFNCKLDRHSIWFSLMHLFDQRRVFWWPMAWSVVSLSVAVQPGSADPRGWGVMYSSCKPVDVLASNNSYFFV